METTQNRYDPELRMFAEQAREPSVAHLAFLRWLAEHGRLEHNVAGRPGGEYSLSAPRPRSAPRS
jgi:hypothetical protein